MWEDRNGKLYNGGEVKEYFASRELQSPQTKKGLSFKLGGDLENGTSVKSNRATMFDTAQTQLEQAIEEYFQELFPGLQRFAYVTNDYKIFTLKIGTMKKFLKLFGSMDKNSKPYADKVKRLRLKKESMKMIKWLEYETRE